MPYTPRLHATYVVFVISSGVLLLSLVLYRGLVLPLRHISQQLAGLRATLPDSKPEMPRLIDVRLLARNVTHMTELAQEYYRKHLETSEALSDARGVLSQIRHQHGVMFASTNGEIARQYQSVIAYAHDLEEHIARRAADPGLRYDFDDVCESSFNLKLIQGALSSLHNEQPTEPISFFLSQLVQQTMLALAPSLDRRAMQLTTAEVNESVAARADPATVVQVVWMLLLGIIRYAANESTLRIRCLKSQDGRTALMSIVVSELSPGALSAHERTAHLMRQLEHLTPHMFAETIRIHANLQLAELLLRRLDASIEIVPLTSHACEICLRLPAA